MRFLCYLLSSRSLWLLGGLFTLLTLAGCDEGGNLTETRATVSERNLSAIAGSTDRTQLRPVARVPRAIYATARDLDRLLYPGISADERAAVMEGFAFFTTPHTPEEGAGTAANQPFCLGCHRSSEEGVAGLGIVSCDPSVSDGLPSVANVVGCNTQVSRAARSTPTNFAFTAFDPTTGGGRPANNLDAVTNTGRTAAFTIFGDFFPAAGAFNPLAEFAGFVQHTRPSLPACVPDPIIPISVDPNLQGGVDPVTGVSALGGRRTSGERAGPPYIGRGLMEAIPDEAIVANDDPSDGQGHSSSLSTAAEANLGCRSDCVSGRHNEGSTAAFFIGGDPVIRVGRFGLRAAGPTILQFVVGGAQGELGFTSPFNMTEINDNANVERAGCEDRIPEPELTANTILSCRNLIRMTAPPEFGDTLLSLLRSADPTAARTAGSAEAMVQRGAQLFGIDLIAFANRMIDGRMPVGGSDGRDPNGINQTDRGVNCVGCHTPIFATGQSPSEVGARHLSNVWAPIFSDLLLHDMGEVTQERISPHPRFPIRLSDGSFDISRNLADDTLPGQGLANAREFRTPPLMGMGRMGPPFLHDARVYLSSLTVNTSPASTVFTNSTVTNMRFRVQTLDDAIRMVIELHDLPAPDPAGRVPSESLGCPVPPGGTNRVGPVVYSANPADNICPSLSSGSRSEARMTMFRFRALSAADQQALIEFLKQL